MRLFFSFLWSFSFATILYFSFYNGVNKKVIRKEAFCLGCEFIGKNVWQDALDAINLKFVPRMKELKMSQKARIDLKFETINYYRNIGYLLMETTDNCDMINCQSLKSNFDGILQRFSILFLKTIFGSVYKNYRWILNIRSFHSLIKRINKDILKYNSHSFHIPTTYTRVMHASALIIAYSSWSNLSDIKIYPRRIKFIISRIKYIWSRKLLPRIDP